ncbi:MAG: septation protein A [Gammaproteobacteria bacterium]|nr:septation protein A [Gammaproteobacteria bacterium]
MKLLFDIFPVILFFGTYWLSGKDFYVATAVAIVASFLQVGLFWLKNRRFEKMHLISFLLILVFGGLTLILRNNAFFMWKVTVLNWLFAIVFVGSEFIGKKNLVERMLGEQIELPAAVWRRMNLSWAVYFFVWGAANLYVVHLVSINTVSEAFWVNFKLFGYIGLTLAFIIAQAVYLARFMPQEETKENSN